MHWFIVYLIPSLTYYLASTAPTLIQAVASRCRGGVKIRKVTLVQDSGGCIEVQLEAHERANAVLEREPCEFIKVWHPFDVFKTYRTSVETKNIIHFLFRPVGPFTKELATSLTTTKERPAILVDGFYLGADKTEMALQHDCVTMVAGGVAVTQYLTLIPAILRRIEWEGEVKIKTIALHWVCR